MQKIFLNGKLIKKSPRIKNNSTKCKFNLFQLFELDFPKLNWTSKAEIFWYWQKEEGRIKYI